MPSGRRQITARTPINHQDCAQGFHYIIVYHKRKEFLQPLYHGAFPFFKKNHSADSTVSDSIIKYLLHTKNIFNIHVQYKTLHDTAVFSAPEVDVTTTVAAVQLRAGAGHSHTFPGAGQPGTADGYFLYKRECINELS